MEHAFHDQHDAATGPIVRDLDPPPVAPDSGGVAKARKLGLPDFRRPNLIALSAQTRGRAFEREVPEAVEAERSAPECGLPVGKRVSRTSAPPWARMGQETARRQKQRASRAKC